MLNMSAQLLLLVLTLVGPHALPADPPAEPKPVRAERAENYVPERIGRYEVRFNRELLERDPALADRVRLHLEADLDEIDHLFPARALERLSDIVIWVEHGGPEAVNGRGMGVHWSTGWLREHGYLEEKVGCVEIASAQDFIDWRRTQPYMLLHEFAHAYHWRIRDRFPPELVAAYEKAKADGRYESTPHTRNRAPERAYAMTNVQEYFAELSEAYFALNDFYPYTRPHLEMHDPEALRAIEKAWNLE